MDFPAQAHPHPHGGWPGNELEEVLSSALGVPAGPSTAARIVEVLGRSFVWVPLPNGGGPQSGALDLPTMDFGGQVYVPVFWGEYLVSIVLTCRTHSLCVENRVLLCT